MTRTVGNDAETSSRGGSWMLGVMICVAGWLIVDDIWDAGVLKTAGLSLLCAVLVVPTLGAFGRQALGAWFQGSAARLLVLSAVLASCSSLSALEHASVTDRLLIFGLAQISAVCGLLAAQRRRQALGTALLCCGAVLAAVCLAQALGYEQTLTSGSEQVVGLSGNTTRAGALLALVVVAAVVSLLDAASRLSPSAQANDGASDRGGDAATTTAMVALRAALLALCFGALLLTRARGARWALLGTLVVFCLIVWRGHAFRPSRHWLAPVLALLLGTALAAWTGGSAALTAHKLDDQASVFSGDDPTTSVRLSLAGAAWAMTAEHPLSGVGLGRFREFAAPYRDPAEAARPGLGGSVTEAEHPHNEVLLAFAEGGWPGGLLLLLALGLTLRRGLAQVLAEESSAQRLAFGVFVSGLLLGMMQDAWTDPGTAVPFFAAMGFLWAPRADEPRSGAPVPRIMGLGAMALGLGLGLAAWPRLDAQMSLRSFYQRTEAAGAITSSAYAALVHAANVGAGDPAMQRMLLDMAPIFLAQVRESADKAAVVLDIEEARQRLASLSPAPDS